jgi:hypothetical protein
MARSYRRDANGRFSSGGGAPGRLSLRQKAGTSVTSPRLRKGRTGGTAKPKGTISGTRFGRSVDQFARETSAAMGRTPKTRYSRQAPTLAQSARAAGLRTITPRTSSRRVLRENSFTSSAPRGTIPKRDPGMAITNKDGRRTLLGDDGSSKRKGRMSWAAAMKRERARPGRPAARVKALRRKTSTIKR